MSPINPIVNLPEPLWLGLHALVALGREPEQPRTTETLSESIGCSKTHLSMVLQKLCHAGYVTALRGPGGGYQLALRPEKICMLHVFELLGGPFIPTGCTVDHHQNEPCLIGAMMDELTIAFRDYLATKTFYHLLRFYELAPEIRIGVSVSQRTGGSCRRAANERN